MIRSLSGDVKLEEEPALCYDKVMAEHPKALLRALIIFLFLILYTAIIGIVSFPTVRRAFDESGVLHLIRSPKEQARTSSTKRMVNVVFSPLGASFASYTVEQQRLGSSIYHDTFEALFAGVPLVALEEGAITYIASGTKLLGLTYSSNIIYLNLSKKFLASSDMKMAYRQLKETASLLGAKDIVLLIEGAQVELQLDG
ncbi:MAG TPA: GerMN domain-containing protein [Sphaerochaeta sp.]|nr:GerMN domain-containing protein [Sphaerochaeta sp.]HQB55010.1 GerMN domain-containing protein [Sphaerochaeta sp.]